MKEFFPEVKGAVPYEGPDSKNPLAFKYYDASKKIGDKTMEEHLRFAVAYWHTFCGSGMDPFGAETYRRPWNTGATEMENAELRAHAAFEFFTKLGVKYYCFHDRDVAPQGESFSEYKSNLEHIVQLLKKLQGDTGVNLLWGTSNMFSHPRFAHGAATNPDPKVFAIAAAQVKNALEATVELGGQSYVFWGGREGYETLLNTDMKLELDNMARFFRLVCDHADKIGFKGQFLIEPKPKEPTKHMYDFDAATVLGFLKQYDLWDRFNLNIEANHATLAGHTFEHDLTVASINGKLGNIDANVGDLLLGWDTDQFSTSISMAVKCMLVVLKQGGLAPGGLNFDAKVRRGSFDTEDLFHAHIGSMDAYARGLLIAQKIIEDGPLDDFVAKRYAGYGEGVGKSIVDGGESLDSLEQYVLENGDAELKSGRQEMLENILLSYL